LQGARYLTIYAASKAYELILAEGLWESSATSASTRCPMSSGPPRAPSWHGAGPNAYADAGELSALQARILQAGHFGGGRRAIVHRPPPRAAPVFEPRRRSSRGGRGDQAPRRGRASNGRSDRRPRPLSPTCPSHPHGAASDSGEWSNDERTLGLRDRRSRFVRRGVGESPQRGPRGIGAPYSRRAPTTAARMRRRRCGEDTGRTSSISSGSRSFNGRPSTSVERRSVNPSPTGADAASGRQLVDQRHGRDPAPGRRVRQLVAFGWTLVPRRRPRMLQTARR
jgi:hypothetical protein